MSMNPINNELKGLNYGTYEINEKYIDLSYPSNNPRRSPRLASKQTGSQAIDNSFIKFKYNEINEKSIIKAKKLIKIDQNIEVRPKNNEEIISDITLYVPNAENFEKIDSELGKNISTSVHDEFIFELTDIMVSPPGTRMKQNIRFYNDKIKFQNATKYYFIKQSIIKNVQIIPNGKSIAFILRINEDTKIKFGSVQLEYIKININTSQIQTIEPTLPNELNFNDENYSLPIEDILIHVFQNNKYSHEPKLYESFKSKDEIEDDEDEYDSLKCSSKNGTDQSLQQAESLIWTASPMKILDLDKTLSQVLIEAYDDPFRKGKYKFNITFKYENFSLTNIINNKQTLFGFDEEDASLLLSLLEQKGITIKRMKSKNKKSKDNKISSKVYDQRDVEDAVVKTWGDNDKYQEDEFLVNESNAENDYSSSDDDVISTQFSSDSEQKTKKTKKMLKK